MTVLVALAGALAILSGLLKLFGRSRIPGEIPLLPLLEILAGAGMPLYPLTKGPAPGVGFTPILFLLGLVFVSSISRAMSASTRRRKREESEGGRLATYVKFLSVQKKENSPLPSPFEDS